MKLLPKILFFSIFLFSAYVLKSQTDVGNAPIIPLKTSNSILFGKDIIINDKPTQNQKRVAICSAFNGWLYALIGYNDPIHGTNASGSLLRSTDSGISWSLLFDTYEGVGNSEYTRLDILALGNTVADLKLFIVAVFKTSLAITGQAGVSVYDGDGSWKYNLFLAEGCYDMTVATDFIYPAISSNPNSLGLIYSMYHQNFGDSLCYRYSSDGGITISSYKVILATGNRLHKVALAYGRSPSWPSGRYFAAWEERDNLNTLLGHIYTSHSEPNFTSPFITPIQLDNIDPGNINMCRNPTIACQYNNVDNDSSNLTEIIMFDRYNAATQRYDVKGYHNLQTANNTKFKPLNLTDSLHNNLTPDINFNPYDSTFMMTWHDSTAQKLSLLAHNYRLHNPDQWTVVSPGYNDTSNLSLPYPKVAMNFGLHTGANAWIAQRSDGKGVAMFDAVSNTWGGVPGDGSITNDRLIAVYPNPCNTSLNVAFKIIKPENVTITLINLIGRSVASFVDKPNPVGRYNQTFDVSNVSPGSYVLNFRAGNLIQTCKVVIIR